MPGGTIRDLGFSNFGKAIFSPLINNNRHITRHFSLTPRDIILIDPFAKALAAQEGSQDTEQGSICAVANTTCSTWINTPGEVET